MTRNALIAAKTINDKDYELIDLIISENQGKAKVRTITAQQLVEALKEITERLMLISSKTDAVGTVVEADINAQKFPSAYKYTPESTWFRAEYCSMGWRVTSIFRYRTASPSKAVEFTFTEATKQHMIERMTHIAKD